MKIKNYRGVSNICSKVLLSLILLISCILFSCTDLTESVPSEATGETFFSNEAEILSAMGEAYIILANHTEQWGLFGVNEVTTDGVVIPQRGQDWFDGGVHIRMHTHTYRAEDVHFNTMWTTLYRGVNTTNRLMVQLEEALERNIISTTLANQFISELRALRAFFYFYLLDNFGNVPIIEDFRSTERSPGNHTNFQAGRTELFQFLESELIAVLPQITDNVNNTYGRLNRYGVHFLLGKLYLNAGVYTGIERYSDAITQFSAIIESGHFSLTDDYLSNFRHNNTGTSEIILVIPYDEVFLPGFNIHMASLHPVHQRKFGMALSPWNGWSAVGEFFESFEETDQRRDGMLFGPQYGPDGEPLMDPGYEGPPIDDDPHVNLTIHLNELFPNAARQAGPRFIKYDVQPGYIINMNNDFPIFRYADVFLSRAEAQWRINVGDPLSDINIVRERAGVGPFTELNAENILAERGRELYMEAWRRQDQIRFAGVMGGETAYNDPWRFKEISESYRNVFPIPRDQLAANPNLTQNPGYN